jgi:hypothetical protein
MAELAVVLSLNKKGTLYNDSSTGRNVVGQTVVAVKIMPYSEISHGY